MTLRLGVIGDPIAHSASPRLHRAFLAAAGLAGSYDAIRVSAGDGARAIADLRARGYTGLNVTTPLKEEAFAAAATHDAAARASGSVNTLVLRDTIAGSNTDGIGALGALADAGLAALAGANVLVLGAGPTARASLVSLVAAGARTMLWNRTTARAHAVASELGATVWTPEARVDAAFATLPPNVVPDDAALVTLLRVVPIAIDANYGARATLGTLLGRGDVRDGAAMLRASARASFELFREAARSRAFDHRREGDSNSRDL